MKKAFILLVCLSNTAHAGFYIDWQGVKKTTKAPAEDTRRGVSDGYTLLTNKHKGVIFEIGTKSEVELVESFIDESDMRDALPMLIPDDWNVFVDEQIESLPKIGFDAANEPWPDVLSRIGDEYGLIFTIDWDQSLIEVAKNENFTKPNFNDPITIEDPNSGNLIYIYSRKPKVRTGHILMDGQYIPVKVVPDIIK